MPRTSSGRELRAELWGALVVMFDGRGKILPGLCYDDVVEGLSFAAEARESDAYDHFSV